MTAANWSASDTKVTKKTAKKTVTVTLNKDGKNHKKRYPSTMTVAEAANEFVTSYGLKNFTIETADGEEVSRSKASLQLAAFGDLVITPVAGGL